MRFSLLLALLPCFALAVPVLPDGQFGDPLDSRFLQWIVPNPVYAGRQQDAYLLIRRESALAGVGQRNIERSYRVTVSRPFWFTPDVYMKYARNGNGIAQGDDDLPLSSDYIGPVEEGNVRLERFTASAGVERPPYVGSRSDIGSMEGLPESVLAEMQRLAPNFKAVFPTVWKITFNVPNTWYRGFWPEFTLKIRESPEYLMAGYMVSRSPVMTCQSPRGIWNRVDDLFKKGKTSMNRGIELCNFGEKCAYQAKSFTGKTDRPRYHWNGDQRVAAPQRSYYENPESPAMGFTTRDNYAPGTYPGNVQGDEDFLAELASNMGHAPRAATMI